MRFGGACGWAGAGGTLDRTEVEPPSFCDAFESGQYIACRTHVAGLFLNPDTLSRVGMLLDGGGDFRARQRVELVEKENGGIRILAATAFGAQLVADFAAGNQDVASVVHFAVSDQREEARLREFLDV